MFQQEDRQARSRSSRVYRGVKETRRSPFLGGAQQKEGRGNGTLERKKVNPSASSPRTYRESTARRVSLRSLPTNSVIVTMQQEDFKISGVRTASSYLCSPVPRSISRERYDYEEFIRSFSGLLNLPSPLLSENFFPLRKRRTSRRVLLVGLTGCAWPRLLREVLWTGFD